MTNPIPRTYGTQRTGFWRGHLKVTWEDYVFAVITPVFFLLPGGEIFFHLYTLAIIILVLSLAFRRGIAVSLARFAILIGVLFLLRGVKGYPLQLPLIGVLVLTGCGIISTMVGAQQRRSQQALQRSFCQTLNVLARALECRDPYTEGHSRRTAGYAAVMGEAMGLDEENTAVLKQAGLLHDLGKMGMPDAVLRKDQSLTPEEKQQVKRHPEEGARILQEIPALAKAATLVRHHHEHYDGSGYPDGLAGQAIPLAGRILTVADAFDALTTDRPYRRASAPPEALRILWSAAGQVFDPAALQVLEKAWQEGKIVLESRSP